MKNRIVTKSLVLIAVILLLTGVYVQAAEKDFFDEDPIQAQVKDKIVQPDKTSINEATIDDKPCIAADLKQVTAVIDTYSENKTYSPLIVEFTSAGENCYKGRIIDNFVKNKPSKEKLYVFSFPYKNGVIPNTIKQSIKNKTVLRVPVKLITTQNGQEFVLLPANFGRLYQPHKQDAAGKWYEVKHLRYKGEAVELDERGNIVEQSSQAKKIKKQINDDYIYGNKYKNKIQKANPGEGEQEKTEHNPQKIGGNIWENQ